MYQDFSSWGPEQERTFAVFEQHTVESGKKAWVFGSVAAVASFLLVILILVAFPAEHNRSEAAAAEPGVEDTLASEAPAAVPTPAPAPAPAETAPETAPAEGAAADPGAAATPSEGSTAPAATPGKKLSPTELVGQ